MANNIPIKMDNVNIDKASNIYAGESVNNMDLLNNVEDKESYEPQSSEPHSVEPQYEFRGRHARQVTINAHPSRDNKFYKVIIPYNFDKKKYFINNKEIEFYENKRYLRRKLEEFNNNNTFNIEKDFAPQPMQKVYLYVPAVILSIIVMYLMIVISAFFSFNIVLMFTLVMWIKKGYHSLQMFKFILLEKFKIKEIHNLLNEENNTQFCMEHKLKWILGQSGYWLEVQKLIE